MTFCLILQDWRAMLAAQKNIVHSHIAEKAAKTQTNAYFG